ncbi:hypothetical protein TRIUR3_29164 [Triticum urartu]|uniref:At2g24240-like C-terminal beta-propeller domain-containing protein n=1 Tax=Triticum urartu TaxID=4572 RepID=M7ZZB0_TRIUA|nr:hypothetical protein TRIUR3_29164 [Triticum urartu]
MARERKDFLGGTRQAVRSGCSSDPDTHKPSNLSGLQKKHVGTDLTIQTVVGGLKVGWRWPKQSVVLLECSIFASCKGRLNEYGIGVWDGTTGDQTGFFYEPPGCALGDADKLQWLDGTRTLMAATMFPRADSSFISLLDFRDKNVVWSWCDVGTPASLEDKHAVHAIAMEDGRSICVINQYDDLGFLDLRSSAGGVRWRSRSKLMSRKKVHAEETCYPKLATHAGQLFASTNDAISVFTGPDHALTSTLRGSDGGAICDFSIGGDRLFALHNEENVFDVWETPPPPII